MAWIHDDGFTLRFERREGDSSPTEASPGVGAQCVGCVVRTRFHGARARAVAGEGELAGSYHFLRGEARHHVRDARAWAQVRCRELYDGIDLVVRALPDASPAGALEYDLLLAPGADLAEVLGECDGAESLAIDAAGRLVCVLRLPDGSGIELRQEPPVAWQDTPAGRRPLRVAYVLFGGNSFGFTAGELDSRFSATVDPGVVWSTFLGGGSSDSVNDLRWRPGQGVWLGGWAGSSDFPTTVGAFRTTGVRDGFVARLREDGQSLVFATYLGGSSGDEVRGIDVDNGLGVVVAGWTLSTDFPVTPGARIASYQGASPVLDAGDAFVTRLDASGGGLVGSTYLGTPYDEVAEAVRLDAAGNAVVAGWTTSPIFPTTPGAYQPALGGPATLQSDGFLTKVAPDARSFVWSTYLGAASVDQIFDLSLDANGGPVVVGVTVSANFPTTIQAFRTTAGGGADGFVTRLDAAATTLVYSSFLGGIGTDRALGIDLAVDGSMWICGGTSSPNFPVTAGAAQGSFGGGSEDGFALRLPPSGPTMLYGSYLGGNGADIMRGIVRLADGSVLVVGEAEAGALVTPNALQTTPQGGSDGYIAHIVPNPVPPAVGLPFASYLGGSNNDVLRRVAVTAGGIAVIGGYSWSAGFPTTTPVFQPVLRGIEDGVVLQLDLQGSIDGGLLVGGGAAGPAGTFEPGTEIDALATLVRNTTARPLELRSVRLFVGGVGDAAAHVHAAYAYRDDPAVPGVRGQLLAGPIQLAGDNCETAFDMSCWLQPGEEATLTFVLATRPDLPDGNELACAVTGFNSWSATVFGAGGGTPAAITGTRYLPGSTHVARAPVRFSGDDDQDGILTASDLRRLCVRLGQPAGTADPDRNGIIDGTDLVLLRDAILGRPLVTECPAVFPRGMWVTLGGWLFEGTPSITLGSRALVLGAATEREFAFRVDAELPTGMLELQVALGGRTVVSRTVVVQ
jgi:hypothetical protein